MTLARLGVCALLVALVIPYSAHAADEAPLSDPVVASLHTKVTRFLDRVADGEETSAFDELLLGSPLSEQATAVKSLVEKSKEITTRYGSFRDSEQVSAKRIGKDVVLMKYLFKCDKYPLVWYFTYYRDFARSNTTGDDYWVVIGVRFDTHLELLGY